MPITINTNVAAMSAQRNLEGASMRSQSSLSKLSSGSRVPTAKEDAASLSIGTGLKLDVTALRAAQTNAAQGTSLLQIADGAFGQISNILDRMKSLATTAQSGQLSSNERGFLNQEFGLLRNEIDRISATTEFNGQTLLGTPSTLEVDNADVGVGGTATAILADDGFVAYSFDSGLVADGDDFAVFYDDSTGNLTINNTTQGRAQTVNLGAAGDDPVSAGATRDVEFSDIGVTITLNNDFNGGNNIGAGADIGTLTLLDGSDATVVFEADAATSAAATSLSFQVGAGNGVSDTNNRIDISIAQGSYTALVGGAPTALTDASTSATASDEVDTAIGAVNTARANIGSTLNRLEFAQSNLAVSIENTEAARSTLMDVDVSAEMTKFTSEQVLIQAGVSMLAQANQQPSLLLRLLQ